VSVPAGRFQLFPGQNCQIKVIWGSGRPSGSYCSTKILNVELLLFTALAVVLLFMFNIEQQQRAPNVLLLYRRVHRSTRRDRSTDYPPSRDTPTREREPRSRVSLVPRCNL